MPNDEKIKKLIDDHLIGVWHPAKNACKAYYKVTEENLIDFISKYFEN